MARQQAIRLRDPARETPYGQRISALLRQREVDISEALHHLNALSITLSEAGSILLDAIRSGRKCLLAGNGGSAAEAQHFAAELLGRFRRERNPYAAISLTTDSSVMTALSNDYGYEDVFARQIQGLGKRHDVFVAFSTSGESENIVRAAQMARHMGLTVVAVTGMGPGRLGHLAHVTLAMPAQETALVQELHMVTTHILCEIVESELCNSDTDDRG